MMDLDKKRDEYWDTHFPDPQDARVFDYCAYSGREIFEGETCIELPNGDYLINDKEILIAFIDGRRITAGE